MSKHQPNQDFYKIKGRQQSDGPDRGDTGSGKETPPRQHKGQRHEGEQGQPNFIPGEAPVGESSEDR